MTEATESRFAEGENFKLNEFDLEAIARHGCGNVSVSIKGYWSHDPISVWIDRSFIGNKEGWRINLSHSSGGRDPKEVKDDLDAAINFGEAMTFLACWAKELKKDISQMEFWYQDQRRIENERREAEKAALAAKIANDPALGEQNALGVLLDMANTALKKPGLEITERFYLRGRDDAADLIMCYSAYGRTNFYYNGTRYSRDAVMKMLGTLSTRRLEQ